MLLLRPQQPTLNQGLAAKPSVHAFQHAPCHAVASSVLLSDIT